MPRLIFPKQTPEERAVGDAFWAAFDRDTRLRLDHQADQFRAQLHAEIEGRGASQRVCGATDCEFRES